VSKMDVTLELGLARNACGPLSPEIRRRIVRYLARPTEPHWNDIAGIIVNWEAHGCSTIWQAVCQVDPIFPRQGRTMDGLGRIIHPWERIPEPGLVARALRFATH
jgi:hypothetical protein